MATSRPSNWLTSATTSTSSTPSARRPSRTGITSRAKLAWPSSSFGGLGKQPDVNASAAVSDVKTAARIMASRDENILVRAPGSRSLEAKDPSSQSIAYVCFGRDSIFKNIAKIGEAEVALGERIY